jgi:hypothetical protein
MPDTYNTKFLSCFTVNTLHLHYKEQTFNSVKGNNGFLLREPYEVNE